MEAWEIIIHPAKKTKDTVIPLELNINTFQVILKVFNFLEMKGTFKSKSNALIIFFK